MKKELVDYIGSLLFSAANEAGATQSLHLHSEKQFRVNGEGRLEQEQSVLTDIVVDKSSINMHYRLPDGREVCFTNAVKQVDYTMNNDYTIGSITYETEQRLLFILQCEEDRLKFYEASDSDAARGNRTLFEIC
jgi:hypothetical protein